MLATNTSSGRRHVSVSNSLLFSHDAVGEGFQWR